MSLCECGCGFEARPGRRFLRGHYHHKTHGQTGTALYRVWAQLKFRRGTFLCERWTNFEWFRQDVGERPEGAHLRRNDPNRVMGPDNYRWELHRKPEKHGASHGASKDSRYSIWASMIQRCENPRNAAFDDYGGRGIRVCERWLNSFEAFRDDVDPRPPGAWLERDDNDGHYEPGNVRWATRREQQRNKRTNVMVTARGRTLCVADWARETGIPKTTLLYRAAQELSGEEFLAPVKAGEAPCACGCGATAQGRNRFASATCRVRLWRRERDAASA